MNLSLKKSQATEIYLSFILSWLFAVCAQCSVWLPFGLVPIYLHPMPIFLSVYFFGRASVIGWALYIFQGALGIPFFAGYKSGALHLLGPTGGYIFGMLIASIFLLKYRLESKMRVLLAAHFIVYMFGLIQLYFFVPFNKLFCIGLYPFLLGGAIKIIFVCLLSKNK